MSLKPPQKLFFISSADEMKYPYETLFDKLALSISWFSNLEELSIKAIETPAAIILDLDPLSRPLETHLEKLRLQFPKADLIALSSSDSAQTALMVIHSGFADFLLKPLSPEELFFSVKKVIQRTELFQKFQEPETNLVRALTQISSGSTPSIIRLSTIEFLQSYFRAQGAVWLALDKKTPCKILAAFPKGVKSEEIQDYLSDVNLSKAPPPVVSWTRPSKKQQVFLSCLENKEAVLLWGIDSLVKEEALLTAKTLLEHAELSLLNLEKFEEIKHLSFIDELTGLFNSRYLKYALTNAIHKSNIKSKPFSVLFIDVDHFKSVNTGHGHVVGSDFLIAIGKSIRNCVRELDLVFRYGGDEFIVVLHDMDLEGSKTIAERIRASIARRLFSIHHLKLQTTVSIGVALYPQHAKSQEDLLKLADLAMYSAKERSRNTVEVFSEAHCLPEKEEKQVSQ